MQWPTLQGIPLNQGSPNNPGASGVPRGTQPSYRPAKTPPSRTFPTQFSISHESGGPYLIPGNKGPGLTYLNPTGQQLRGVPFTTEFEPSLYQVAPIKQPTFPIFHFLSQL